MSHSGEITNCTKVYIERGFEGSVHTATLAVCTVLVIFVLVLGCFGNCVVLLSAFKCKKLRSNFDLLILNLAGADFFLCFIMAPIFLFLLFSEPPDRNVFCGTTLFFGTATGLLSLLSLVAIAIHRQARVVGRVKDALTFLQTALILACVWLLSLGIALGGTLHVSMNWDNTFPTCQAIINSPDRQTHNFVLFFLAPVTMLSFAIIIVAYGIIAWAVRSNTLVKRTDGLGPDNSKDNLDKKCQEFLRERTQRCTSGNHCSVCANQALLDKENKAVTMCLVVILTIVLCWGPLIISQFVEIATGESIILYQVKLCGIALVFLNSALDPYIYAQHGWRTSSRYGKVFQRLIHCDFSGSGRTRLRTLGPSKLDGNRTRSSRNDQLTHTVQLPSPKQTKRFDNIGGGGPIYNPGVNSTYSQTVLLANKGKLAHNLYNISIKKYNQVSDLQAVVKDVKHLVHKSCCHSPPREDQSLIEGDR